MEEGSSGADHTTAVTELGGDHFVRSLQVYVRSTERQLAEAAYEKQELENKVAELCGVIEAKDRLIREYLRRVAVLEYAIKKDRLPTLPRMDTAPSADVVGERASVGISVKSCRDLLRQYLLEVGDMVMPDVNEETVKELSADMSLPVVTSVAVHHPEAASRQHAPVTSVPDVLESSTPAPRYELTASISASLGKCTTVLLTEIANRPCLIVGAEDGLSKIWFEPSQVKQAELKSVTSTPNSVNPSIVLRGHDSAITAQAVGAKVLVSGNAAGEVRMWALPDQLSELPLFPGTTELDTVTKPNRLEYTGSAVKAICVCSEGEQSQSCVVAIAYEGDSVIRIFSIVTDSTAYAVESLGSIVVASSVSAMTANPSDPSRLIIALTNGTVCQADITSRSVLLCLSLPTTITAFARMHDRDILLANCLDGSVLVTDANSLGVIHRTEGVHARCFTASTEADPPGVIVTASGVSMRIATLESIAMPCQELDSHTDEITDVCIRDGILVSCGKDGRVNIFRNV